MKEIEYHLNSRSIKLPLTIDNVLTSTHLDLTIGKDEDGLSIYRELSEEEKEWIFFLNDKAHMVMDKAEEQRKKFLMKTVDGNNYSELLSFFDIQIACAMFLLTRCGYLLERDTNIKNKNLSEKTPFVHKATLADTKVQATAPQEVVTVNLPLWDASCKAACKVLVEIMGNGETGITKDGFRERMKAYASGYSPHTNAVSAAWKALPDRYKNGPGCPKK